MRSLPDLAPRRALDVGFDEERFGRLQLGRQSVYFSHHWFINDAHGSTSETF